MTIKRQAARKTIIFLSFLSFPLVFYYFSPQLIIMSAREGIINGSFIVFVSMFLVSLVLGRLWCGWLCPAGGGLQEICLAFRKKRVSPKADIVKYVIWVVWLGVIAAVATRAGGYKKIDFFYQTNHGLSVSSLEEFIRFLVVMLVIVVIALAAGRRGFCHAACWMAPFMILGRKLGSRLNLPRLQLAAASERCTDCLTCTRNCPQSLEVNQMVRAGKMEHTECVLCGTCVDGCPNKVLSYQFKS